MQIVGERIDELDVHKLEYSLRECINVVPDHHFASSVTHSVPESLQAVETAIYFAPLHSAIWSSSHEPAAPKIPLFPPKYSATPTHSHYSSTNIDCVHCTNVKMRATIPGHPAVSFPLFALHWLH